MLKIINSPMKYVQGPGEIKNLASYYKTIGSSGPFFILSPSVMKNYKDELVSGFSSMDFLVEEFKRECSKNEIDRLQEKVKNSGLDAIIGVGGGKAMDTAKAVAYYLKLPVIIVPTIASTDAPTSALSVLYTDDGVFDQYLVLPKNPEYVVVDSEVIAKAPSRLLVAGMGDALATYFEARSCMSSSSKTMSGGITSLTGLSLAKLSYEVLLENGLKAKLSCDENANSYALEAIIEANTYLSGIGFESGGLGAAHSIHNGLTVIDETHNYYHGEKVAFGTITHLVLENAPSSEIFQVVSFCKQVGLPTKLSDIGIKNINPDKIMEVAKAACAEGETIHNMPFAVTPQLVYSAILTADKLGR
ncbi:MAG: glycerol dehydrogenase [Defluviitaleaceae bacterium]|nr:glycerol dehydrogenase [Defluviitaleaceae bacterium]